MCVRTQIQKKEPVREGAWSSIIGVGCLGLAQMVAGAALTVFSWGAAAQFGMAFISEGVSDLITAAKAGIKGEFSWKEWGIQKAISIAISLVTAGMGAVKAAAKATGAFVKTAATKASTMICKQGLGQAAKQLISETTKEGLKLAALQMGLALAKGVGKKILNQLRTMWSTRHCSPRCKSRSSPKCKIQSQRYAHSQT